MCRIKSVSVFTNRPTIYNCYCCIARCCRHHTGMFESDLLLFVGFLLVLYLIYVLIVHDHIVTVPYDCVLLVPRLDNPDRRWRMFRGGWHFPAVLSTVDGALPATVAKRQVLCRAISAADGLDVDASARLEEGFCRHPCDRARQNGRQSTICSLFMYD